MLFAQPFDQAPIKEHVEAPRHWPLCWESTGGFPSQRASKAENVSIWWRHHGSHSNDFQLHGMAYTETQSWLTPYGIVRKVILHTINSWIHIRKAVIINR